MAVYVNQIQQLFTLETKNSTYQMGVHPTGVLLHYYYGRKTGRESLDYLYECYDVGFSGNPDEVGTDRTFSLDTAPQEYGGSCVGDYRLNSIGVRNADGTGAVDLRFVSYEQSKGKYGRKGMPAVYGSEKDADSLVLHLKDKATGLAVDLWYSVWEEYDLITRAVTVRNETGRALHLTKAASMLLDILYGEWEILHFHGRHCMERQLERVVLPHGRIAFESNRGTSSHQHNPFVVLCDRRTQEDFGECIGVGLLYSGNFSIQTEKDQLNRTRLVAGIQEKDFDFVLEPGEEFETPEAVMVYSGDGFTPMSQKLHRLVREHICRGKYKLARRPVLINNWEATYFDFNEEKILDIAKGAAELGVEMLVLDDGWFGKRDADNSGLGDWIVNTGKLKGGLKPLAEKINALGLKFGLWFEPEMVSEDSDLYRAHPDWAVQIPGRKPCRGRFQLVLDMTRKDVRDYLFDMMCAVLDEANIEYVKWDMNRSVCDAYSALLPPERQGEFYHRYVLGVYELYERLIARYPDILWEGCSGGGGRFDLGQLYYTPQIWCSDDTDAIERLKIQYGTSFAYPISTVGSHVSASPNHQTGRSTPFETRGVVAMAGTFGYELDLNLLSDEEKERVTGQIERFKKYYDVIHFGDYYRLTDPFENELFTAWEYVSQDKGEALVHIVTTHVLANTPQFGLRLKGLLEEAQYEVQISTDGELSKNRKVKVLSGAALMHAGIVVPAVWGDYKSSEIYLKRK